MRTNVPGRPTLLTPTVTTCGASGCGRASLDTTLDRVQSPPFEVPVVLDLTGCVDADRAQLLRVFDVLRWRSVWSAVAVVCSAALQPRVEDVGFAPTVPVYDTVAAAWCAVATDGQLRGPGRRGVAPLGTFGVGRVVRHHRSELVRVDALRRTRPVIRWP